MRSTVSTALSQTGRPAGSGRAPESLIGGTPREMAGSLEALVLDAAGARVGGAVAESLAVRPLKLSRA